MTSDQPQQSQRMSGGFAGPARKKAADDILAAQEAMSATLPIRLRAPSDEERAAGVVACFDWASEDSSISGDVSRGEAGLVITRTEMRSPTPAGITMRALRSAPLGEIIKAVRAHVALEEARRRGTRVLLGEEPAPGLFNEGDARVPDTSGRTIMTADLLRSVALAYIEETGPGKDRRAIQRMAARFDRPEGTLRTWVSRARKEGWLGPGSKGRIGAEPGPLLLAWQLEEFKRQHPGVIDHSRRNADGTVTDISEPQHGYHSDDEH